GHDQVCALCHCVHRFVGYGGPCRVDYAVIKVCAATLSIPTTQTSAQIHGRGRDEDYSSPPAQIPACAANAPGSSLRSTVGGKWFGTRMPTSAQPPIGSTW